MSTLHVAFFSGDITRSGGTENVSVMIANALCTRDNGLNITFISLFEESAKPFFAIDSCIERYAVYSVPTHGIQRYFETVRKLKRIIQEQRIDILIDIDGILDMYSLPLKRSTGVKIISWEHFNYHQNPGVPYRKLTRRWAARKADAIVTLTEADRALYEKNLHLQCPVLAIANPMQRITPEPVYNADSRIIISSGRLTYQKGFDMLIDVAAQILPQHPDWQWLVLGEGEDRPMLEGKIAQAGIGDQLILKGRVDNMDEYYRNASMFVMTSRFEGLPMVLLEAKAYKLPIVSFDCETGPAEIVQDGTNGELVPVGDITDMVGRIDLLIDDDERRQRYSDHALNHVDQFNTNVIVNQWQRLLDSLSKAR